MERQSSPLRVIMLTILTCLILVILVIGGLYLRDSMLMREGDINYNAGNYSSALAIYRVFEDVFPFRQEAFQKADYCNYNLGREAMEGEEWQKAKDYFQEVKSFELDSVNRLIAECDEGLEAEADRMRSFDSQFLEDMEKAILLRLDPDDDGDVLSRELMFLKKYERAYFQDQKLWDYAKSYLAALRNRQAADDEVYFSERQVAQYDGDLQIREVLNSLYEDYGFMADNVQFVGEYIGNLDKHRSDTQAVHEIYADMHEQVDPVAAWPAVSDYGYSYYHTYQNRTTHTVSLQFHYYVYTGNNTVYLGETYYNVTDVAPGAIYLVQMSESWNQDGVNFYVDWTVTDIK